MTAPDAPNANVTTTRVVMRWTGLTVLLAIGVVYFLMRVIGFVHGDALFIAGISTVPLAVAAVVGLIVWTQYWKME